MEPRLFPISSQEYISLNSDEPCVAELISCNDNKIKANKMTMERFTGNFSFEAAIMSSDLKKAPIENQNMKKGEEERVRLHA